MKIFGATKTVLLTTLTALYVTGTLTWVLENWFLVDQGLGPEPSHFRVWWLQIHSVVGLFFFILFGYLLHSHVRPSWMRKRRRASGGVLTAWLLVQIVSVPLLFYVVDEGFKGKVALVHTYAGLSLVLPFFYHYFFARD